MALRVDVRVTSSGRLQAHLDNADAFLLAFVRAYSELFQLEIIPTVAGLTPKRSGRLARSLSVRYPGRSAYSFGINAAFYGPYVRFQRHILGARSVPGLIQAIAIPRANNLARKAAAIAQQEVGL